MINNNAQNLIKQVLSSADSVGLLQAKDVGGTTRYIADFSAYPSSVEDTFTLVAANAGISIGSGSTAATANDYQLVSTITSGLTGSVTSSNSVDTNGDASVTFTITLTNTSSSNISISEIGYKQEISASDTLNGTTVSDRVFLLDRSVFDAITIAPSNQAVLNYTLKAVVTNNGGAVGSKSITTNGTYNAITDNLDGYSTVTVNVQALLGTKSITTNGTYNASGDSLEGYSSVTVNVSPNVDAKSITSNGTYNASSDSLDGYSSVTVAVSPNVGTKNITSNGTYNSSSDDLDGYSQVAVSVNPNVDTKSITTNGTYIASSDNLDGYSEVVVNVSGGGGILGTKTIYSDGVYEAQDDNLDGYSEVTVHTSYVLATPLMTSNTTPSGVVSASSYFNNMDTYQPWYAFSMYCSGDQQTWTSASGDIEGAWIRYEFPTAQVITKLVTVNRTEEDLFPSGYDNGAVQTFIFQGSNNGVNWTDIQTCNITSDKGHHEETFIINNSTAYLYYRLYVTAAYGDSFVGFAQVRMYKDGEFNNKIITQNGFYDAHNDGLSGYSSVTVNIGNTQINPYPQGASAITFYNSNGITINSSSIDAAGTASLDYNEAQAGYEGFVVELNVTAGEVYVVEMDYQNVDCQYITDSYVIGWLLENSPRTNYNDWTLWTNNIQRNANIQHLRLAIVATGNKIYANFNVCGYSDNRTNNIAITNFKVYEYGSGGGGGVSIVGTAAAEAIAETTASTSFAATATITTEAEEDV